MKTLTTLLLLSIPSITFGFSAGAHRIIAEIAWQQMAEYLMQCSIRVLVGLRVMTRKQFDQPFDPLLLEVLLVRANLLPVK